MTETDFPDSKKKASSESPGIASEAGDETSTKATEENDSDCTLDPPTSSDENNDDDNGKDGEDGGTTNEDDTPEDTRTQEEKDQEAKEKEETEKERIEELKIKYKDWPLRDIKEPHDNDVKYGRGGGTNHHPGNKRYRKMVEDRKLAYVNSKRLDKPLVALEIIREWRAQLPPGRFLKHDDKTNLWTDVGDKKAREKTSQALREKAPELRKEQEEKCEDSDSNGDAKPAAKGEKKSKLSKAILKREHTFGTDYMAPEETKDIETFTWQEGLLQGTILPPGRRESSGSIGVPFMNGPPHPQLSPPDFPGRGPRREFSSSSMGSWTSTTSHPQYSGPPPPGGMMHRRSGSWTQVQHPPSPQYAAHHQRSGSWNAGGSGRSHSLSFNPLHGASINHPAPTGAFDQNIGSGSWGPPLPPPGPYDGYAYQSGSSFGSMGPPQPGPYRQVPSPSNSQTPSPPYNVMNAHVDRIWPGGGALPPARDFGYSQFDGYPQPVSSVDASPPRGAHSNHSNGLPRPAMVKRDTSNQNENFESKPHKIKRAALNRDQSATSNRLKQQFIPEVLNRDMESLQERADQIRLGSPVPPRPEPIAVDGRAVWAPSSSDSGIVIDRRNIDRNHSSDYSLSELFNSVNDDEGLNFFE